MKLAIMQPYWFPYIGYWQLISCADTFVLYDNIQYTKKGWVNRNRFLLNGKDEVFSIALSADASDRDIVERSISPEFDRKKVLRRLQAAYAKAPCFDAIFPHLQQWIETEEQNLFKYLFRTIEGVCRYLDIETKILISSQVEIGEGLYGAERVLALCHKLECDRYINPIGGIQLYDKAVFANRGVSLNFLRPRTVVYDQFAEDFIPWLSIIDVLMFNPRCRVQSMLKDFDLE
jgi:hypothetical protein